MLKNKENFEYIQNILKVISVGNGTKEYYGNFTLKEKEIIKLNTIDFSLNLFSGESKIGNIRIDYCCKNATHNCDVFDYLNHCINFNIKFKTIIIDAPYNNKFADKYQKIGNTPKQFIIFADAKKTTILFDKIKQISPDIIIIKSWNYYILKGYFLKEGYVCYAGGYRKPTFLLILKKDN